LFNIIHVFQIVFSPGSSAAVTFGSRELRENELVDFDIRGGKLGDVPIVESQEEDSEMR